MIHTPEPWEIGENHCDRGTILIGTPEDYVCEVYQYKGGLGLANAKRIVDCVNACKGLSEKDLCEIRNKGE